MTKAVLQTPTRDEGELIVGALNVRSLQKYAEDVAHDEVLCTADVLCLSETWTNLRVEMNGYRSITSASDVDRRGGGTAVYAKSIA